MAYCKPCCEQAKHQEGLSACLVLDVILDGIRDEVLHLEEDLQDETNQY